MNEFELVEFAEAPRAFHERDLPESLTPQIWWNRLTEPALVLGSTQRDESIVDAAACAAAGVDVTRRRSGGGAVLLIPGEVVWFDVIIPTGAMGRLGDDVHAPMLWLGEHLAHVLRPRAQVGAAADVEVEEAVELEPEEAVEVTVEVTVEVAVEVAVEVTVEVTVKGPGMVSTPWSSLICFDGLGPGEVLLGGRKLVGISQRRTRSAARLQCCWYRTYDPARLVGLLAADVRPAVAELSPVATLNVGDVRGVLTDLARQL